MVFAYVSIGPSRFQHSVHDDANAITSLLRVAKTYHTEDVAGYVDTVKSDAQYGQDKFHTELKGTGLQHDIAKLVAAGHPLFLELPAWLDTMPVSDVPQSMYKALAVAYLVSAGAPEHPKTGDFFVLHLITAAWGLEHVVHKLPEIRQRETLKCFWAAAVVQLMLASSGMPQATALGKIWRQFDVDDGAQEGQSHYERDSIVDAACREQEEHNIKLTYVARELWRRYRGWRGFHAVAETFTATPGIGPGRGPFTP